MSIDKDLKVFIETNINLIEKGFWELLYKKASTEYLPRIGRLTNLLTEAGINPLLKATRIPPFFFEYTDINNFLSPDIESIGGFAFSYCESLTAVELPNIKTIERFVFYNCINLKYIFLGASLKSLREHIFYDCSLLEVLDFGGTLEQWAKVNKSEDWNTGSKIEKIRCTDGIIAVESYQ